MYEVISIKDPFYPLAKFSCLELLKHWAECAKIELTAAPTGGFHLSAPGLERGLIVSVPQ